MSKCKNIQDRIDLLNSNQLEDDAVITKHINQCASCKDYLNAVIAFNQDFSQMQEMDAEDRLADSTLASILSLQENTEEVISQDSKSKYWLKPQWAHAIAASFMLISMIALFPYNSISDYGLFPTGMDAVIQQSEKKPKESQTLNDGFTSPYEEEFEVEFMDVEIEERTHARYRSMPKSSVSNLSKAKPQKPNLGNLNKQMASAEFESADDGLESIEELRDQISNDLLETDTPSGFTVQKHDNSEINESKQSNQISNKYKGLFAHRNLKSDDLDENNKPEDDVTVGSNLTSNEQIKGVNRYDLCCEPNSNIGNDDEFLENKDLATVEKAPEPLTIEDAEEVQELDELEKVVATGSRIRRTDLEEPAPVFSMDSESNSMVTKDEDGNITSRVRPDTGSKSADVNQSFLDSLESDTAEKQQKYKNSKEIRKKIKQRRDEMRQSAKGRIEPVAEGGKTPVKILNKSIYKNQGAQTKKESHKQQVDNKNIALDYLSQLQSLQEIEYKKSSGYWANTYLPGDSGMRLLNGYLEQKSLLYQDSFDLISANIQPFDAPLHSAMEVYLSADHTSLENNQPTRMRLQVGLQASDRKGGQRGVMNIGLVIDIKDKEKYAKEIKALLESLLKSKQSGDQISLTFTGSNGGLKIAAKDYRHGPIKVAIDEFLQNKDEAKQVSLYDALGIATATTKNEDDPQTTLGNSLVLLISDRSKSNYIKNNDEIEKSIHKNATEGIILSTISLAENSHQALIHWALAGQGHHRSLLSEKDAKRVINEELMASSKAVARALRLRIRLAEGVKLVQILGSKDLNEEQSQRVRDAENSIDQRLSKNLGIMADRGKDEEGIQIVIPHFYAGDTHVILLDVVASQAGPLADVSLRYKDLIHLKNSNSQKQLNLNQKMNSKGPLQLNVSKNVLAYHFSETLKQASQMLSIKQRQQAIDKLNNLLNLYQSLQHHYPSWKSDSEINKDIRLIQKYRKLLQNQSTNGRKLSYIINSLQYISWRKITSNPI